MTDPKTLLEGELARCGVSPPLTPLLLELNAHRITPESSLPPVKFLFRLFDRPCFPRGELVGVAGKAKSGKTFFTSMLMACCFTQKVLALERHTESTETTETKEKESSRADLTDNAGAAIKEGADIRDFGNFCVTKPKPLRMLWYDTEQSESSTQEILRDRILPMVPDCEGSDIGGEVFNVRSVHWSKRMELLEEGVSYFRPDLVVVDGIRDLVDDINNGVIAQDTIERLMRLASCCHCCIVCVLHQNKGAEDRNLRGWIGTELMNKAFEVYTCEKLMPERIFSVEQTLTRKYDIERLMYVRVDERGLPFISEPPASTANRPTPTSAEGYGPLNRDYIISRQNGFDVDLRRLFHEVLKNGPRYYSDLQTVAMRELNCHDSGFWNKQFSLARDQGIIVRTVNRENKSVWTLPQPQQQPDLFCGTDAPPF